LVHPVASAWRAARNVEYPYDTFDGGVRTSAWRAYRILDAADDTSTTVSRPPAELEAPPIDPRLSKLLHKDAPTCADLPLQSRSPWPQPRGQSVMPPTKTEAPAIGTACAVIRAPVSPAPACAFSCRGDKIHPICLGTTRFAYVLLRKEIEL